MPSRPLEANVLLRIVVHIALDRLTCARDQPEVQALQGESDISKSWPCQASLVSHDVAGHEIDRLCDSSIRL